MNGGPLRDWSECGGTYRALFEPAVRRRWPRAE